MRYAVYFVPPAGNGLYRFGAAVLGYDAYSRLPVPHPRHSTIAPDAWEPMTREPRRYGFHATLKAPFRLADGCSVDDLRQDLRAFAAATPATPPVELAVARIGCFVALVPRGPAPAFDDLAARCVKRFDRFRAPLSPDERARRIASGLDAEQIAQLDRWGYPHVFEHFRFHMTLTGPLPEAQGATTHAVLAELLERECGPRLAVGIDRLALVAQESADSLFHVVEVAMLSGG